jgi:Protein of unknown function (DUF2934)
MSDNLKARIRQRAHRMWLDQGRPTTKAEAYWELARPEHGADLKSCCAPSLSNECRRTVTLNLGEANPPD